jgi:hypothetical protein
LKHDIRLGAYGWRHKHWLNTFYPEDLPEDWQLTYYANEFNTVLVPADYWRVNEPPDCEHWLDSVHDDFRFFVECHAGMLDYVSLSELSECLKALQPQLSALVFLDDKQQMSASVKNQFYTLIDLLRVDVFASGALLDSNTGGIWRQDCGQQEKMVSSSFGFIENDLSDLRAARALIENFAAQLENADEQPENQPEKQSGEAAIIVFAPQLQANDLSRFRSVLEIMGY